MYKIAVLGSRDTVVGFKAMGLDTFPVENAAEGKRVFQKLAGGETPYAIIYVQENLAQELADEIGKYKDAAIPAVILIPGKEGPLGIGQSALRDAVERAVGSDIL